MAEAVIIHRFVSREQVVGNIL